MDHLIEKTMHSKKIYEGKIIDLVVEDVELPNGNRSKREVVKHPGAVAVIAVTEENKIVMVRQFRKALEKVIVEIPAGKLEKGEVPEVTAKRELEEETGYTSETLEHLISFYTSPGFADEIVHLYFTNKLEKLKTEAAMDDDEFLDVIEVTLEEAEEMVLNQQIYDAKTAYAVLYMKLHKK